MRLKAILILLIWTLFACSAEVANSGDSNESATTNQETNESTDESTTDQPGGASWTLSEIVDLEIEGVSPELIQLPDGRFLLFATSISQDRVYESTDGISFSKSKISVPMGSDYSVIQKSDGSYLLYFVGFDMQPPTVDQNQPSDPGANQPVSPQSAKKKVFVSTSDDLVSFSPPEFTGIAQDVENPAWGVPDTYLDLNGNIKMMWVEMVPGEKFESLLTATSKDGITFTRDEKIALTGGYVDPYMLHVEEGNWILLLSTTPDPRKLPQKLFIAYSKDGENWEVEKEPLLQEADSNNLDPTAVEISENSWRMIYTTVDLDKALSGPYSYKSALLQLTK